MALYTWIYLTIVVGFLFVRSVIYQNKVKSFEREIMKMMERRNVQMNEEYQKIKSNLDKIDSEYQKYTTY